MRSFSATRLALILLLLATAAAPVASQGDDGGPGGDDGGGQGGGGGDDGGGGADGGDDAVGEGETFTESTAEATTTTTTTTPTTTTTTTTTEEAVTEPTTTTTTTTTTPTTSTTTTTTTPTTTTTEPTTTTTEPTTTTTTPTTTTTEPTITTTEPTTTTTTTSSATTTTTPDTTTSTTTTTTTTEPTTTTTTPTTTTTTTTPEATTTTSTSTPKPHPNCTLVCKHGGVCLHGEADYGALAEFHYMSAVPFLLKRSDEDGQYCWCPPGRTGLQCRHKYEYCDPEGAAAPSSSSPRDGSRGFACFHGSECANLGSEELSQWACDCTGAHFNGEDDGLFAGRHCEHRATSRCKASSQGGKSWFCTNGGECQEGETDPHKICKCPDNHAGPHCEYEKLSEAWEQYKPQQCTLGCRNGGSCIFGFKDYSDHTDLNEAKKLPFVDEKHHNGMHCACPAGYTGMLCQIQAEKCGQRLWCYNGSECKKAKLEDGTEKRYCDCTEAATKNASYAGMACQHRSGVFCDPNEGMSRKMAFCVNGGTCYEENGLLGCDCQDGWSGQHCEFHKTEPREFSDPKQCRLECKNDGVCAKGVKEGSIGKFNDLPFNKESHIDFEHCVCPAGYSGIDCSVKIDVCGDDQHVCAYGAACEERGRDEDGMAVFTCNCDTARNEDGDSMAGKYCHHPATEYCVLGNKGASMHSFCTNGGKCVGRIASNQDHPGCICQDGWTGDHCEFRQKKGAEIAGADGAAAPEAQQQQGNATREDAGTKRAAVLFSVMVAVIGAIIAGAVVLTKKFASRDHAAAERERAMQQQRRRHGSGGDTFDAEGGGRTGSEKARAAEEAEDGELDDVEIL